MYYTLQILDTREVSYWSKHKGNYKFAHWTQQIRSSQLKTISEKRENILNMNVNWDQPSWKEVHHKWSCSEQEKWSIMGYWLTGLSSWWNLKNALTWLKLRYIPEIVYSLQIEAASCTETPSGRWTELNFKLTANAKALYIPILMIKGCRRSHPIICFIVTEHSYW